MSRWVACLLGLSVFAASSLEAEAGRRGGARKAGPAVYVASKPGPAQGSDQVPTASVAPATPAVDEAPSSAAATVATTSAMEQTSGTVTCYAGCIPRLPPPPMSRRGW